MSDLNAAATLVYNAAIDATDDQAETLSALSYAFVLAAKAFGLSEEATTEGFRMAWKTVDPAAAIWEDGPAQKGRRN